MLKTFRTNLQITLNFQVGTSAIPKKFR